MISKDSLIKTFKKLQGVDALANMFITDVIKVIKEQPEADVAPVVHGEWLHLMGDEWRCSECDNVITTEGSWDIPKANFCEECGAKMDRKKVAE